MNRREFHQAFAFLTLSLAVNPAFAFKKALSKANRRLLLASSDGQIFLSDLTGKQRKIVDLGWIGPHGFLAYENNRKVLVIGKEQGKVSSIDLENFKVERTVEPSEGNRFYGHAAYADDLGLLITSEAGKSGKGTLVFRHPASLKPERAIPSHGLSPHDLVYFRRDQTVAVCNASSEPERLSNIAFINAISGKLIKETKAEEKNNLFGHFYQPSQDLELFVSTQKFSTKDQAVFNRVRRQARKAKDETEGKRLSELLAALKKPMPSFSYIVKSSGDLIRLEMENYFKESIYGFSVAGINGIAAVTHGPTQGVAFFDLKKRKLISFVTIPDGEPSAISALPNGDFLTTTTIGAVWRIFTPSYNRKERLFEGIQTEHSILV